MLLGPVLLLLLHPLPAQSLRADGTDALELRAWLDGEGVRVSLRFDSRHSAQVISSLKGGLKSQLTFQLRLYRRQNAPLDFLGDRLVSARELVRIASLDLIDERFRISDETGQRAHAEQEVFLEELFSVRDFRMTELAAAEAPRCYIMARARLEPVRVAPPLDIIRLVTRLTSFSSAWVRAPIEIRPEAP